MKRIDITGQRFGRLVALRYSGGCKWECLCDCGAVHFAVANNLKRGRIRSCGCIGAEMLSARRKQHGLSRTPEYGAWTGLIQRCTSPLSRQWKDYGGRGISVCDRWLSSFLNFQADMGPRPAGHSIDRIDNDGNYEPGNCRWATRMQQSGNRRCSIRICAYGKTLTATEWAKEIGIPTRTISDRIEKGWSPIDAISYPLFARGYQRNRAVALKETTHV